MVIVVTLPCNNGGEKYKRATEKQEEAAQQTSLDSKSSFWTLSTQFLSWLTFFSERSYSNKQDRNNTGLVDIFILKSHHIAVLYKPSSPSTSKFDKLSSAMHIHVWEIVGCSEAVFYELEDNAKYKE